MSFLRPTPRKARPVQRYPVADFPSAVIYLIGRTRPQADCGNSLIDDDIQGKVSLALIIRLAPAAHFDERTEVCGIR